MRTIYVRAGQPREIAVAEDGRLVEYLLDNGTSVAEAVYLGKVERVVSGMKAAFVDIGQEKKGFLPLEERSRSMTLPPLREGQRVLVQVKKDAQGTKGAFLTRDICLCGEYVIVMPLNRYIGISARIEDEGLREAVKKMGQTIADGHFGLVMRAGASGAEEADIREETEQLLSQWEVISKAAPTAHAPSMIHRPRSLLDSLLDDYMPRGVDSIVTNDKDIARALRELLPVTVTEHDPIEAAGMDTQRDKALRRHVWLDSGGSLVIDRCEAMTVIDVNTAKFTGKRELADTILRLNLEACGEIARQVRLRNLSGIILMDMIDMDCEEHRAQVLERLNECFAADRVKTVIHGFTALGLIEMTRKKSRQPLEDDWTQPCPHCQGAGRVPKEENHG
ncbi:MAG: Rne/Rng family ribonuclease [Aristaeellaceae bacterium]